MLINTKERSTTAEIMDDFMMEGKLLKKTLDQIAFINNFLGGNQATIEGLISLLPARQADSPITILDLGCGSGELLRLVADYGRKKKLTFKLTGIDANAFTIDYARNLSANYPEINFLHLNIFDIAKSGLKFDIALATLCLHHFKNEEIKTLLTHITKNAGIGIVINDLHRCRTAYYLFKIISIFISNPMVRHDGAISVLRGFKKKELLELSQTLEKTINTISWRWAFRFQWTIKKLCV